MTIYEERAARLHIPNSRIIPRLLQMLAGDTDAQILLALPADVPTLTDTLHQPSAMQRAWPFFPVPAGSRQENVIIFWRRASS